MTTSVIMRVLVLFLGLLSAPAMAGEGAWHFLAEPGTVGLMRHGEAPGVFDPEGFRIKDCTTQRQLNDTGRAQAKAMGQAIRRNGISVARVYTSQWCRCRETAELLAVAPVEDLPALNSLRWEKADKAVQLAEIQRRIGAALGAKILMVTHQFNISELTGEGAASGEIVVVRPQPGGTLAVVGRIPPQ